MEWGAVEWVGRGGVASDGVGWRWGGVGSGGEKKYQVPGMQEGRKMSACARFRRVGTPGALNTSRACEDKA